MKKILKIVPVVLAACLIIIQFVPVDRTNPPVTAEIQVPPEIDQILRTSCYDCHSNQTEWPFYSFVAPVSWWVADHVKEGRAELNFSEWGSYSAERQLKKLEEMGEELEEGKMPLPSYLPMHAEARLSSEQVEILVNWSKNAGPFAPPPPLE